MPSLLACYDVIHYCVTEHSLWAVKGRVRRTELTGMFPLTLVNGGTLSNLSLNGKRYHHSGQWVSNNRRLYYSRAVQMPISILISRQARLADCNCKSFEIVLLSLVLA